MDWNVAEANWKQFKGEVQANWAKLTASHLEVTSGKRMQLADKIRETYGVASDQPEQQIRSFEARNADSRPVSSR